MSGIPHGAPLAREVAEEAALALERLAGKSKVGRCRDAMRFAAAVLRVEVSSRRDVEQAFRDALDVLLDDKSR